MIIIVIDYCKSARISRFKEDFSPLDASSSSSVFDDGVVPAILAFVGFFPRPRGRFVVAFSETTGPAIAFGIPSFADGVGGVASAAGRAGATALTFDTIHPK